MLGKFNQKISEKSAFPLLLCHAIMKTSLRPLLGWLLLLTLDTAVSTPATRPPENERTYQSNAIDTLIEQLKPLLLVRLHLIDPFPPHAMSSSPQLLPQYIFRIPHSVNSSKIASQIPWILPSSTLLSMTARRLVWIVSLSLAISKRFG